MTRKPRSHVRKKKKTNLDHYCLHYEAWVSCGRSNGAKKLSAFTGNELGARGVWELVRHIVVTFSRGEKFS